MIEITSTSNNLIKHIRSLKLAKYRKEHNQFVVEGQRMVEEALKYGCIKYLVYSKSYFEAGGCLDNDKTCVMSDGIFDTLGDTKSPQGVLAVLSMEQGCDIEKKGIIVALEDVQNPLNVGTIIRTADALGAAGIIMSAECADVYSPKVLRGTMGSVFHLPIVKCDSFLNTLMDYKAKGFTIVAGDLKGKPIEKTKCNAIIVVGNEGNGISESTRNICDTLWKLNMPGKAESLNASVALGIMLYTLGN